MSSYSISIMHDSFETKKNTQASAITAGILGALLLICILIKWPLAHVPPPVIEDGIEVNLGTGDLGSGTDQPMLPGEPAPSQQMAYSPPKAVRSQVEDVKDIETDDKNADAPEIVQPTVSKPNATRINDNNKQTRTTATRTPEPTPAPPQPKAVLGRTVGGTGNGGNGAESYQKGSNEGIAGGTGDQGRPGGTPGATNYEGGGKGNSGVAIARGLTGRSILSSQSFTDEFNENGKIAMDIVVSEDGKVTAATYQPRGSTTSNSTMIAIAKRRAFELKFNKGDAEQRGTVEFMFKLRS